MTQGRVGLPGIIDACITMPPRVRDHQHIRSENRGCSDRGKRDCRGSGLHHRLLDLIVKWDNTKQRPRRPFQASGGSRTAIQKHSWTSKGPAEVSNLVVQNSTGAGVVMAKGGVIGSNWTISGNGANGVSFVEFHPRVEYLLSEEMLVAECPSQIQATSSCLSYTHLGTE